MLKIHKIRNNKYLKNTMKLVQIEAIKPRTGAKTEPQAIKLKKKQKNQNITVV